MALGESIQRYTFEYLLQLALSKVSDDVDKREGSIIYDALAPACYVLAEYFAESYRLAQEISVETASGEWLEAKAMEVGLSRNPATAAVKKATFKKADGSPANVPIGTRFSTISNETPLYYVITSTYPQGGTPVAGEYLAVCESPGVSGQQYFGNIVPLDFVANVAVATLGETIVPGEDLETDSELRARYFAKVNHRAFAGNVSHYREMALEIEGVGGVQIYPTWDGGGTVKLSIVDGAHMPIRDEYGNPSEFVSRVQELIDPVNAQGYTGSGLGLAPIDHRVTVVTPEKFVANISGTISLSRGFTIEHVKPEIEKALEEYFASLRDAWDEGSDLNEYSIHIYQSQIVRAALSAEGVANISGVTINGISQDIELIETALSQQVPVLGEVILNVNP